MRRYLNSYPNLVEEFNYKKNFPLTPLNLTFASGKKVWWLCSKGHEWITSVAHRKNGNNCPYCSGKKVGKENNLKFLLPNLAKEWHPNKNGNLKPEDVTKGSKKYIWWLCSKGHEWNVSITQRTAGKKTNCPYCSGKKVSKENNLKFLFPQIAKEWHPTKNESLKPEDVTRGSGKYIWWLCFKGHEWRAVVHSRTRGSNCPKCFNQSSKPEFRILSELEVIFKNVNSRHKFQKTEIDIFIKDINVGIEYDGSYYHKDKRLKDEKKNKFLEENSIKLIRVRHQPLVKLNINDVIVKEEELTKDDLNNVFKSIYNFCSVAQKKLITKYLKHKSFLNDQIYKKYISYFPSPLPQNSLTSLNHNFVKEWNYKKNYPLTPDSFSMGSGEKVWWLCNKGHEWESRITNRKHGNNCPYCSGQKVTKENSFKFSFPNLAKEWHPNKNGNLKPEDVTKSSGQRVWWLCSKGHEWESTIVNRKKGNICPGCLSIKFLFPNLAKEWHPNKNGNLKPEDVTRGSGKKVWWLCSKGHEYKNVVSERTIGSNCPYCSGHRVSKENNLKFLFPQIAKEWHPNKNGNLKPEDVTKSSGQRVWWLCSKSHEYKTTVASRSSGKTGCPYCSGNRVSKENNLKFLFPEIAKEWHPNKNGNLKPEDVAKGTPKKVWWMCSKKHEYFTRVSHRTRGHNCPYCSGRKKFS
jgi:very-short-patch-repair endonuclease/DNA-directed RNA polymerase subunit RPC12/RpoP